MRLVRSINAPGSKWHGYPEPLSALLWSNVAYTLLYIGVDMLSRAIGMLLW